MKGFVNIIGQNPGPGVKVLKKYHLLKTSPLAAGLLAPVYTLMISKPRLKAR